MQALQIQYTGCHRDQPGQQEIQLYACSSGITPEEQKEIGARSGYRRPQYVEAIANDTTLERDHPPVAVRCYPLQSGRFAITVSRYTNVDGVGDADGFFAHTLVVERAALASWPIDYLDWGGWQYIPPPQNDALQAAAGLDAIDLNTLQVSDRLSFQALQNFLSGCPKRPAILSKLITALLTYPQLARALVLRDTADNNLLWTACVAKSLPLPHALNLSLSSYQYAEHDAALFNATTAGTTFNYTETQHGHRFFIFDLLGQAQSTIPVNDEQAAHALAYAEHIVGWLLEDCARAADFHRFAEAHFTHSRIDAGLYWLLRFYQCSKSRSTTLALDEIIPLTTFIRQHIHTDAWPTASTVLAAAKQLKGQLRLPHYQALLALFSTAAQNTGQPRQRNEAFSLWLDMFDALVVDAQTDIDQVLASLAELENSFPTDCADLYRLFTGGDHLKVLQQAAPNLSLDTLSAVGTLWITMAGKAQKPYTTTLGALEAFITLLTDFGTVAQPCLSALTNNFVAYYPDDAADLLILLWQVAERTPTETSEAAKTQAASLLIDCCQPLSERQALYLRRRINDSGLVELLFAEWQLRLAREKDKLALYQHYRTALLPTLDVFDDRYTGAISTTLFTTLSEQDQWRQSLAWINGDASEWDRLPDDLAAACLVVINQGLALKPDDDSEHLASRVQEYAAELHLTLTPDKPLLRQFIKNVRQQEELPDPGWFAELNDALKGITPRDYRRFMKLTLPRLIPRAVHKTDHQRILTALAAEQAILQQYYHDCLNKAARRKSIPVVAGALHFWITLDDHTAPELRVMAPATLNKLAAAIARWNEKYLVAFNDAVATRLAGEPYSIRQQWESFQQIIDNRHQISIDGLIVQFKNRLVKLFRPNDKES